MFWDLVAASLCPHFPPHPQGWPVPRTLRRDIRLEFSDFLCGQMPHVRPRESWPWAGSGAMELWEARTHVCVSVCIWVCVRCCKGCKMGWRPGLAVRTWLLHYSRCSVMG